jgi:hypothetical protein
MSIRRVKLANAPLTVVVGTLMHSSQILRTIAIVIAFKLNNQPYLCCAAVDLSLQERVFGSILLYPWRVNAAPNLIVELLSSS